MDGTSCVVEVVHRGRQASLIGAGDAPSGASARPSVQLAHQLSVHRPRCVESLGELPGVGFELGDALTLSMVVCLELGGTLLELVDKRTESFTAGDVCSSTKLAAEPFAKEGDFVGESTGTLPRVSELGAKALLGDKRTWRQLPGSVAPRLALTFAGTGDARAERGIGVKERDGHACASGDGREGDGLTALLHSGDGVCRLLALGAAV